MKRYLLSIETNTTGEYLTTYATKKESIKRAAYMRTGGLGCRYVYSINDNAHVQVYDTKNERIVYCKQLYKYALK